MIPKLIEKQVEEWYHYALCYPGETRKKSFWNITIYMFVEFWKSISYYYGKYEPNNSTSLLLLSIYLLHVCIYIRFGNHETNIREKYYVNKTCKITNAYISYVC